MDCIGYGKHQAVAVETASRAHGHMGRRVERRIQHTQWGGSPGPDMAKSMSCLSALSGSGIEVSTVYDIATEDWVKMVANLLAFRS